MGKLQGKLATGTVRSFSLKSREVRGIHIIFHNRWATPGSYAWA
jgi:hypothetical protein